MSGVLIIDAGHGGANAAAFLRQFGYEATITLIGELSIEDASAVQMVVPDKRKMT